MLQIKIGIAAKQLAINIGVPCQQARNFALNALLLAGAVQILLFR